MQYKKLENQKLIAERVDLKLATEETIKQIENQRTDQKIAFDEKIAKLENQLSLKDIQVE